MSPISRASTRSVSQLARPSIANGQSQNNVQETSFTTPIDTEIAVAKINTMFPTVPDTHIRMLLKKYVIIRTDIVCIVLYMSETLLINQTNQLFLLLFVIS